MERDEIQGLVDGVMAVLAAGKPGTQVTIRCEADEVEPLATAISDVLECKVGQESVDARAGGFERIRYAFCGERMGAAIYQVVISGISTATREEWLAARRAEELSGATRAA